MTTEPNDPDRETLTWLDGLAGRATDGSRAGAEGQRLRAALLPADDGKAVPDWQRVVLASRIAAARAANQPRYGSVRRWGLVASLFVAVGLVAIEWPREPEDMGLRGAATPAGAVWQTSTPAQDAEALAADLRRLGASVSTLASGQAVLLTITAPEPARAAVNNKLADVETALDAQGHATLSVEPVQKR